MIRCEATALRCISSAASRSCSQNGAVPVGQVVAAPHAVDEQVEPAVLLGRDARGERADLRGIGVVGGGEDRRAAGVGDERGGLLERLGAVHRRAPAARAAAGDVDGGAGGAELDGDGAAAAARGAGDDRDMVVKRHAGDSK